MIIRKKLWKSSELARYLGITTTTLKNHVKAGLIDCITINTHRYFTQEAIDKYLENGRGTPLRNKNKEKKDDVTNE